MELQQMEPQEHRPAEFEQEELREQTPETKGSFQERIAAELKEWGTKVDHLKAEVQKSGAEVRRMFEKQLGILRDRRRAALGKLSALKRSREEGWEEFRSGLEKSLDDLNQTFDQTLSRFREKQQEIAERVKKQREVYVDKMEARFSEWSAKVDALKPRIEKAKTEAMTKCDQQIEELRKKQLAGKEKLEEFKKAGGESWEELKEGMERAFAEMKKSFERVLSRIKKK
jgi:uncharacterized protein YdcH (DUF465 family)